MREIKRLERSLDLLCCVHLGLMTLLLAFSIALLYQDENPALRVLWALGTVIPVQLIHQICLRVRKTLWQYLLCGAVILAAMLIAPDGMRRLYYGLSCGIIALGGLLLNRPQGRIVLTVPRLWNLLACMLLYAFGKIIRSPLMSGLAIALFALVTLSYCLYRNQKKVLQTVREAARGEVARSSVIVLNRRVLLVFVLLSVAVLAAVPWLLRWQTERVAPTDPPELSAVVTEEEEESTKPFFPEKIIDDTEEPTPINYDTVGEILMWVFVAVIFCIVGMMLFALVLELLSIPQGKNKHKNPEQEQNWTVERLRGRSPPEGPRESASGYEKKLRRRYEKLIRSRAPKKTPLAPLTPAELERAAGLKGPGAETVHELYEQSRYSPAPTDKEQYAAFKEAVKSLDPPTAGQTKGERRE